MEKVLKSELLKYYRTPCHDAHVVVLEKLNYRCSVCNSNQTDAVLQFVITYAKSLQEAQRGV